MATIQIKRRTTTGTGPLTGTSGSVKAGEPLIDFNGEHLYIAKADKTANTTTPLTTSDYLAFPSVSKVNNQIDSKITALSLGTAATKNTGTSSGCVPILDSNGKLVDSVIPRIALTNTFVVASQAEMLALSTAQEGDVAVRTDLSKSFILKTTGYSTLANWQELLTPSDKVQSVNGKNGSVTITLSELSGVDTSTFNTHVGSSLHLTDEQRYKLYELYKYAITKVIDFEISPTFESSVGSTYQWVAYGTSITTVSDQSNAPLTFTQFVHSIDGSLGGLKIDPGLDVGSNDSFAVTIYRIKRK